MWRPEKSAPHAVLLVIHGIGEHGGRYLHLAEYFVPKGFVVVVPDQRGCGRSVNRGGRVVERYEELTADLDRFIREAGEEVRGIPLILLGHSLGALTILKGLLEKPGPRKENLSVQGAILSSPAVENRVAAYRTIGVRILAGIRSRFRIYFDAGSAYLTHDPQMAEAHRRDPMIRHLFTAGFLRDVIKTQMDVQKNLKRIPCPLLCLCAGEDHLVDTESMRSWYERLNGEKEWVCYDGFYHELFNEIGREQVFARIEEWLSRLFQRELS
ncbi:MAG: lysophospholipase [Nitrospirae bacterium]|nr:lysophospholipase [Nitrospirota bacterium]